MLVVHTAMLREFRLAPSAVARVRAGDSRQAAVVDRHIGFVSDLLHHHHTGEAAHLWPPLRERLPDDALPLLEQAEAQHAALDDCIEAVAANRRAWTADPDRATRDRLVNSLRRLHVLLVEHLDAEERTLLPFAAALLTKPEWDAIGAAAVAALPKPAMPLVFGMFAYEGDPEVLATMLHNAPAPARLLVPRIAPRVYARRAAQVYGTARP